MFFTAAYLLSVALAHTRLFQPEPYFPGMDKTGGQDSPSSFCEKITFHSSPPDVNIKLFGDKLQSQYGGSLLKYFSDCEPQKKCGRTDPNHQAPIPSDGLVKPDIHSNHPGYAEVYINDERVYQGIWGTSQKGSPSSFPVDYSKCTGGKCQMRYIMAAVHQLPIQLYDNCVTLVGNAPAGSSANSTSNNVQNNSANGSSGDVSGASTKSPSTSPRTYGSGEYTQGTQAAPASQVSPAAQSAPVSEVSSAAQVAPAQAGTTVAPPPTPYSPSTDAAASATQPKTNIIYQDCSSGTEDSSGTVSAQFDGMDASIGPNGQVQASINGDQDVPGYRRR